MHTYIVVKHQEHRTVAVAFKATDEDMLQHLVNAYFADWGFREDEDTLVTSITKLDDNEFPVYIELGD